jgi:phosphoribosyl 1,2-cyclic phosphodiesterase
MKITFWGVRGSIATPGPRTVRYGGNTSCLSAELEDGTLIILDAGTGMRNLGLELMKRKKKVKAAIFFSHFHLDHIIGFPFFVPIYVRGNEFDVYGCPANGQPISACFDDLMKTPFSPVNIRTFSATLRLVDACNMALSVGDAGIDALPLNHPGGGSAYKIRQNGKGCVYMTDNELAFDLNYPTSYESFVDFTRDADVLIHDAMYTEEEWASKRGWGHSSFEAAVRLAADANVKTLVLFHHEPSHDDDEMDRLLDACRKLVEKKNLPIRVSAAREGESLEL